jgi:hypothetical protein
VDEIVYKKLIQAREQCLPLHDIDVQRWAVKSARELNLDEINNSKGEFIKLFNQLSPKYRESEIFNIGQVGIEKELHSTRIPSLRGEQKTYGVVKSKNETTHSYIIQPKISLNGQ